MAHRPAPTDEAQSIFHDLGYAVSEDGPDLRAERKWRTVRVSVLSGEEVTSSRCLRADGGSPSETNLRCFVTWSRHASALRDRLGRRDLPYDWAIIGVDGSGEYEVLSASATG